MSADNYWRVCRHPVDNTKFTAVMGFASNEDEVEPDEKSPMFDTVLEARDYAYRDPIIEYGVSIDRDCLQVIDMRNPLEG